MAIEDRVEATNYVAAEVDREPHIVLIGGTTRAGSTSERLALHCAEILRSDGARVTIFPAVELDLPMYAPEQPERTENAQLLVEALRDCDGLIVASPGYHGGFSGLLKNAIDYIEDLKEDNRSYLDGRAVGCIVTAAGWQGANTTLSALRDVVHALRGWPTPLGVAVNSTVPLFDSDGLVLPALDFQLRTLTGQVLWFAKRSLSESVA